MKLDTKDYIVVIIIIGVACAAGILSAYQYIESAKKDKRDKEMGLKLIDAQEKALTASSELKKAQEKLLQFNIGDHNYCRMLFGDFTANTTIAKVINMGKYPIYDFSFWMVDLNLFESCVKNNNVKENFSKIYSSYETNNITPQSGFIIGTLTITPDSKGEVKINIFFSCRSGFFKQQTVLRKKNQTWFVATYVADGNDKKIFSNIDNGFLNEDEASYNFPIKAEGQLGMEFRKLPKKP